MKIKLPYFLPRRFHQTLLTDNTSAVRGKEKRSSDNGEDRSPKRQRRGGEPSGIIELAQSTAAKHSLSPADTFNVPQRPMFGVTPNSPETVTVTASAPIKEIELIPTANAGGMSAPTCHPPKAIVPSKRPYPFRKDVPRKKKKTDTCVIVRVYEQRKDLEHTDEIEYALMPDGGLDLAGLSERLNIKGCQVSRLIIPTRRCMAQTRYSSSLKGSRRPLFTTLVQQVPCSGKRCHKIVKSERRLLTNSSSVMTRNVVKILTSHIVGHRWLI